VGTIWVGDAPLSATSLWEISLLAETQPGRANQRRADILAIAAEHLNTMGVSLEWLTDIANSLGLSRPALYKYFSDRGHLQFECYMQSCDRLEARLTSALRSASDPQDVLRNFLESGSAGGRETAVLSEVMALPSERREIIQRRQQAIVAVLADQVHRGVEVGSFRAVDPTVVANAVLGMASWAPLYSRWEAGVDRALIPGGSIELLFRGLAADRDRAPERLERVFDPTNGRPDVFDKAALETAKREAIIIAASSLFNSRGMGATRLEDVADAMGLNKRAVYHHMGQKQALVDACVERAYQFFIALMEAGERLEASRLAVMSACLRDLVWAASEPSISMLTPYVGVGQLSQRQGELVDGYNRRLAAGYRKMLEQGITEGSIRPLSVDLMVATLPGVFSWASNAPAPDAAARRHIEGQLAKLAEGGILA
jgi:AcrR family transcriptional regulator